MGWGGGGSLFLTCEFPASGVKFRERPAQLSAEAARGKLLLLGELLLSLVKV